MAASEVVETRIINSVGRPSLSSKLILDEAEAGV